MRPKLKRHQRTRTSIAIHSAMITLIAAFLVLGLACFWVAVHRHCWPHADDLPGIWKEMKESQGAAITVIFWCLSAVFPPLATNLSAVAWLWGQNRTAKWLTLMSATACVLACAYVCLSLFGL